tara:strand:- start:1339 stop:1572 length:234 start_codon:yes stop_codon:yes gene_type:complete
MLEKLVRRIMAHIGAEDISNEDVIRICRTFKLEKLPSHYLFMLLSIFPVIEMVFKRLAMEEIDWSELAEEVIEDEKK